MTSIDALRATIEAIRDEYARRDAPHQEPIPTLTWPDQRHLIPTRCPRPHCGSTLIQTNQPYGSLVRGDASCVLCSRVLVNLRGQVQAPPPLLEPVGLPLCDDCEENEAAPHRRRCYGCASRRRADLLAAAPMPMCPDCGKRPRTIKHTRCNVCRHRLNRDGGQR